MGTFIRRLTVLLFALQCLCPWPLLASGLLIERLPEGGIQPILLNSNSGEQPMLVYFQQARPGERRGALYLKRRVGREGATGSWQAPERLTPDFMHSDAVGAATAAVDEGGRLHLSWFTPDSASYWYRRWTRDQPTVPVLLAAGRPGVEAGSAIAVTGNLVSVAWHEGDLREESRRQVFLRRSVNGGSSFAELLAVSDPSLGACACCSLSMQYRDPRTLQIAYRSAIGGTGRHLQLLTLTSRPGASGTSEIGPWHAGTCPVSSSAIDHRWLVYETEGRLHLYDLLAQFEATGFASSSADLPPALYGRQKHPRLTRHSDGTALLVWAEADGYFTGGTPRFVRLDTNGEVIPVQEPGNDAPIPRFSFAAAAVLPSGEFLVVY